MDSGQSAYGNRKRQPNAKTYKHSQSKGGYAKAKKSRSVERRNVKEMQRRVKRKNNERKIKSEPANSNILYFNLKPKQMDLTLLFIVFMLVMFGIVMIFSSSYYIALTKFENPDALMFLKKQAQWAALGTVAMLFISNVDYKLLKPFVPMIYAVANACLVLVLIFGEERNGAKRWLRIVGPIEFQPSELAKIATILFLAYYIDKNENILKNVTGFIKCMFIVAVPVVLIAAENLSTAIVVAGLGTAMVFSVSPAIWYFVAMALPAVGAGVIAVTLPEFGYRIDRIRTWHDPFADKTGLGFQTVQSLYAVASGGLFGLGLGHSRQKLGYIPEAYNDIIFSIVCEELGLFGASALILLFYTLIYKGVMISLKCADLFGSLIACGITCMVAIQVIINIAVNTNAMPVTGMPLPFISYGGSSLMIMMSCMGILLNVSRYTKE